MNRQSLVEFSNTYFSSCALNHIAKEKALLEELISVQIFEPPIIAISTANNPEFEYLKKDDGIGNHFMLPAQWLPEAKSVISYFFPFTETIRNSNKEDKNYPSKGWFNGRIEGQAFINHFSSSIVNFLTENGFKAVSPSIDKRFFMNTDQDDNNLGRLYTSNWSERHVGYICGIGTFSLSKGLISEKGIAGRLTSIITNLELDPDTKKFQHFEENCIMCGKCIVNCPVQAISFESGKNHKICSAFLNNILAENSPWYGCGKCQVNVPCEHKNPKIIK